MQDLLSNLLVLIVGGSLLGLIVPNEKSGKGVKFILSVFVTVGVLSAFLGISDIPAQKLPAVQTELNLPDPYTEGIRLAVAAEIKNCIYLYTGVYPDAVNVECEYADNSVNVTQVTIQTSLRKDGLLEYVKKNCGLDCVNYEK